MKSTAYTRAIVDALRYEHRVDSFAFIEGGKHPALLIKKDGAEHRVTLHGHRQQQDKAFLDTKLRDIRRRLGEPLPIPDYVPPCQEMQPIGEVFTIEGEQKMQPPMATLGDVVRAQTGRPVTEIARDLLKPIEPRKEGNKDMVSWNPTAPVPPPVAETPKEVSPGKLFGYVARYRESATTERLRLMIPSEVARYFGDRPVYAQAGKEGSWELFVMDDRGRSRVPRVRDFGNGPELQIAMPISDHSFFGKTAAEYLIEGDRVLVALIEPQRQLKIINKGKNKQKAPQPIQQASQAPEVRAKVKEAIADIVAVVDAEAMRRILADIRRIEAACPYRLTQNPAGEWAWRAPEIG